MRSVGQTHLDDPLAPAAAGVLRELGAPVGFGAPAVFGAVDEVVPADSGSGRGLLTCGAGVLRKLGLGDPAAAGAGLGAARGATRWDVDSPAGPSTRTWPTEMR